MYLTWITSSTTEWTTWPIKDSDITELKLFKQVKDDLIVKDKSNIVLHSSHIIIPKALQENVILLMRVIKVWWRQSNYFRKIWFPGIDDTVKQKLDKCIVCQANNSRNCSDFLHMSPLPPELCHTVHMDFCGPFPMGEYFTCCYWCLLTISWGRQNTFNFN